MAKPLTQVAIDNLKGSDKRREIPDGRISGLYLIVQSSGAKSWAARYRFDGKQCKYTIGAYPAVDLSTARKKALEALADVAGDIDPAARKKAAREARKAERTANDRVADVARAFVDKYLKRHVGPGWAREAERLLRKEIVPAIGSKRLRDVRRGDAIDILDGIVDRGAPFTANRALAVLTRLGNWAVEREIVAASPFERIKPPAVEISRERVLSDDEVRLIWAALGAVGYPFCAFGKLLLLTGARRAEVAGMTWSEVDLDTRTWTLPGARTKNGREHQVPLSDAAVQVLQDLPRIGDKKDAFVFTTTGSRPVSGYSHAKVAIDRATKAKMEPWTLHDLRRTVATNLQKLGVRLEVTEAVLNHVSGSRAGIVGVYQRHSWADEKRAALDAWARRLDAIVDGAEASNVVALNTARG
jgi:integrase